MNGSTTRERCAASAEAGAGAATRAGRLRGEEIPCSARDYHERDDPGDQRQER